MGKVNPVKYNFAGPLPAGISDNIAYNCPGVQ